MCDDEKNTINALLFMRLIIHKVAIKNIFHHYLFMKLTRLLQNFLKLWEFHDSIS